MDKASVIGTTAVGLVVGNFIYQAIQSAPAWAVAFERSFFQVAAIAVLVGMIALSKRNAASD